MSAPAPPPSARGTFAPVEFERAVRVEDEIDLQELSPEEREVVEAESFVIFGKANIEQWNDPAPGESNLYIEMDALEQNLDQLLALENISVGHRDVRVGEPLESYQLETDATVHIDADETLSFDAGDELRTQVIREGEPLPGGNGTAEEDALWLAANVFGRDDPRGSKFSQKIRLASFYGDVDGFSVTIDKKDWTEGDSGVRVHDLDFLAVTTGDDQDIKNPGSSYGVAEFQAIFADHGDHGTDSRPDDAVSPAQGQAERRGRTNQTLTNAFMTSVFQSLFSSSGQALAAEAVNQAHENDTSIEQAAESVADDDADAVVEQAKELGADLEERTADLVEQQEDDMDADEVEDSAADLADDLGVDKEVVMAMIDELRGMEEDMDEEPGDEGQGDYSDMDDDEEDEEQADADVEELVEQKMNEAKSELMDSLEDQLSDDGDGSDELTEEVVEQKISAAKDDIMESVESQLSDISENVADDLTETIESQMATGATPGPSGGGVDSNDVEGAISNLGEKYDMEVE